MFNFRFDRKNLFIVAGVILLIWIARQGREDLVSTLLTIPAVLIALTFHEFAHAFVAVKLRR